MIAAGQWPEFVQSLLEVHYDPGYSASRRRNFPGANQSIACAGACPEALDATAAALQDWLRSTSLQDHLAFRGAANR